MTKELTFHRVPFNHLYADLSYRDFFSRYHPYSDGRVHAATYSFQHRHFDFWSKLVPFSTFYVDTKYEKTALDFLRRFPLFKVYSVSCLHMKVIYFEKSNVLLLGSQNLYGPQSSFSELMVETVVPESERDKIVEFMFGRLRGKLLRCQYGLSDIRIHATGTLQGFPFLPCHKEVTFWERAAHNVGLNFKPLAQEFQSFGRVYNLVEYSAKGARHMLAFGRGYDYCGDLTEEAADWLIQNCKVFHSREDGAWVSGSGTGLLKDQIFDFHPIASESHPVREYFLDKVLDDRAPSEMLETLSPEEITQKKIRDPL